MRLITKRSTVDFMERRSRLCFASGGELAMRLGKPNPSGRYRLADIGLLGMHVLAGNEPQSLIKCMMVPVLLGQLE